MSKAENKIKQEVALRKQFYKLKVFVGLGQRKERVTAIFISTTKCANYFQVNAQEMGLVPAATSTYFSLPYKVVHTSRNTYAYTLIHITERN